MNGVVGSVLSADLSYKDLPAIDNVRELAAQGRVYLQLLHYQFTGFEHYDAITFDGVDIGLSAQSATRVIDFVRASEVALSMSAEDHDAVRRKILAILGKDIPDAVSDSVDSSEDSASENSGVKEVTRQTALQAMPGLMMCLV